MDDEQQVTSDLLYQYGWEEGHDDGRTAAYEDAAVLLDRMGAHVFAHELRMRASEWRDL